MTVGGHDAIMRRARLGVAAAYGLPPQVLGFTPTGRVMRGPYRVDLRQYNRRRRARARRRR